jgi:hypothetical protein
MAVRSKAVRGVGLLLATALAWGILVPAAAAQGTTGGYPIAVLGTTYGPRHYTVSASRPGQWYLNFGSRFDVVSAVCVEVTFDSSNPLGPGEQLLVQIPGGSAGQVINSGGQEACFSQPVDTARFKGGAYAVRIVARSGSATVSSLRGILISHSPD